MRRGSEHGTQPCDIVAQNDITLSLHSLPRYSQMHASIMELSIIWNDTTLLLIGMKLRILVKLNCFYQVVSVLHTSWDTCTNKMSVIHHLMIILYKPSGISRSVNYLIIKQTSVCCDACYTHRMKPKCRETVCVLTNTILIAISEFNLL